MVMENVTLPEVLESLLLSVLMKKYGKGFNAVVFWLMSIGVWSKWILLRNTATIGMFCNFFNYFS